MIIIVIDNPKVISTNDMYMHPVRKTKRGSYSSYVVRSPYLKEVQEFYKKILENEITEEQIENLKSQIDKSHGVKLSLLFSICQKDLYEYDVSNLIKAIEDCISRRIRIDDSYNLEVYSSKSFLEDHEEIKWRLKIIIEVKELNYEKIEN